MKFEIFCQYEDFAMKLNFYIFQDRPDGSQDICTSLDKMEFKKVTQGEEIEPSFTIRGPMAKPFLQAMANTLNEEGIRADGEPVLENELTAVKYHLEDMRTLAFNKSLTKTPTG